MKHRDVLLLISHQPPQRFVGIARFANAHGWHLVLENRSAPPAKWDGDGVLTMLYEDEPLLKRYIRGIIRRKIPVVDFLSECPDVDIPRVTGDDRMIGRLAAEHFLAHDFRHAAVFSLGWSAAHETRFNGFSAVWPDKGPERWIWTREPGLSARVWKRINTWLTKRLRAAPKPLAVFAWNDYEATHVLHMCRRVGIKVPEEVAVLGVDNNPLFCEQKPTPLSSVRHNHERIGYAGAAMLERLMNGHSPDTRHLKIKPEGVETRASTDTLAVSDPALKPAIDHIESHLGHPLGAAQIAAALDISRLKLDRLFAARLGRSVGAEILRRRIRLAKRLLAQTNETLDAIASQCGFCNASFFIQTFRRQTGQTPFVWRKSQAR